MNVYTQQNIVNLITDDNGCLIFEIEILNNSRNLLFTAPSSVFRLKLFLTLPFQPLLQNIFNRKMHKSLHCRLSNVHAQSTYCILCGVSKFFDEFVDTMLLVSNADRST